MEIIAEENIKTRTDDNWKENIEKSKNWIVPAENKAMYVKLIC